MATRLKINTGKQGPNKTRKKKNRRTSCSAIVCRKWRSTANLSKTISRECPNTLPSKSEDKPINKPITIPETTDCANDVKENNADGNNDDGNDNGAMKFRFISMEPSEDVMAAVTAARANSDYVQKSNADGTIDVVRRNCVDVAFPSGQNMFPQRRRRRRRSITKSDNHKLTSLADFVNRNNDDRIRLLEIAMTPYKVFFFGLLKF